MKVLIATKKTQGQRKNDFSHTTDGELVTYGFECDGEAVDGSCGCKRALVGFDSHKATTTMEVATKDLSPDDVKELVRAMLTASGWITGEKPREDDVFVAEQTEDALRLWGSFDTVDDGAIVEKRGKHFNTRLH